MEGFQNLSLSIDNNAREDAASIFSCTSVNIDKLPSIVKNLSSPDAAATLTAVTALRTLLSVESNPHIAAVVDAGAIAPLIALLKEPNTEEIIFEAAWALTNIASGNSEQTDALMAAGVVPPIQNLMLNSRSPNLREQACWCIGNIAGDGAIHRDSLLRSGTLELLIDCIKPPVTQNMVRLAVWAISGLSRSKPPPSLAGIKPALPVLLDVIHNHWGGQEAEADALWAVGYICDGDDDRIQAVVDSGIIPAVAASLLRAVSHHLQSLAVPALRALGNILTGSESQTQAVLDQGVFPSFMELLSWPSTSLRREVCWGLSNIAAGAADQIHGLIHFPGLLDAVFEIIATGGDSVAPAAGMRPPPPADSDDAGGASGRFGARLAIVREASWVLSNLCTTAQDKTLTLLVKRGIFKPLSTLLQLRDPLTGGLVAPEACASVGDLVGKKETAALCNVLEGIQKLLKCGKEAGTVDLFIIALEEAGGVDLIEALQRHPCEEVYEHATMLIENHLGVAGTN